MYTERGIVKEERWMAEKMFFFFPRVMTDPLVTSSNDELTVQAFIVLGTELNTVLTNL